MAAPKLAPPQPLPFQLSLRIRHPSMDPAQISRELGIEPEHSFRSGQPRHSKSGLTTASVHSETYWLAPLDPASWFGTVPFEPLPNVALSQSIMDTAVTRNLTWALALCAARFKGSHSALLQGVGSGGGTISLLVTLSPTAVSSFSLRPEVGRMFGELGITLEFEITND